MLEGTSHLNAKRRRSNAESRRSNAVSFRFAWFRFVSFRFVSLGLVSFRFVSFRLVSFRFVSKSMSLDRALYSRGRTVVATSTPRMSGLFRHPLAPAGSAPSEYIMEHAIAGDFALVKAWKGDTEGNLIYRKTSRNHNPAIATAGRITIAEVEELVPAGELEPGRQK